MSPNKPITILLVGADGSGKTTLLQILKKEIVHPLPGLLWETARKWSELASCRQTFGFNVENVRLRLPNLSKLKSKKFSNWKQSQWTTIWRKLVYGSEYMMPTKEVRFCFYDVGGGERIRGIWKNYYAEAHGVIFLMDATLQVLDKGKLNSVTALLESVVMHPYVLGKPVLVLGNVKDASLAASSVDALQAELSKRLNLVELSSRVTAAAAASGAAFAPQLNKASNGHSDRVYPSNDTPFVREENLSLHILSLRETGLQLSGAGREYQLSALTSLSTVLLPNPLIEPLLLLYQKIDAIRDAMFARVSVQTLEQQSLYESDLEAKRKRAREALGNQSARVLPIVENSVISNNLSVSRSAVPADVRRAPELPRPKVDFSVAPPVEPKRSAELFPETCAAVSSQEEESAVDSKLGTLDRSSSSPIQAGISASLQLKRELDMRQDDADAVAVRKETIHALDPRAVSEDVEELLDMVNNRVQDQGGSILTLAQINDKQVRYIKVGRKLSGVQRVGNLPHLPVESEVIYE